MAELNINKQNHLTTRIYPDILKMSYGVSTFTPRSIHILNAMFIYPPGYSVVHRHRGSSADRRGGGVAVIYRDSVKCTPVDVGDYSQFESLAVKVVGRQVFRRRRLRVPSTWRAHLNIRRSAI